MVLNATRNDRIEFQIFFGKPSDMNQQLLNLLLLVSNLSLVQ